MNSDKNYTDMLKDNSHGILQEISAEMKAFAEYCYLEIKPKYYQLKKVSASKRCTDS